MPILNVDGKKFRLGDLIGEDQHWTIPVDEKKIAIEILHEAGNKPTVLLLRVGERIVRVSVEKRDQNAYSAELNGRPLVVRIEQDTHDLHAHGAETIEGPALVTSPMAGKIASVKILPGAFVEEGQALIVLEAMKMENEIAAPKKGTVKDVYVQQGALAKSGDKLVLIE